jgi:hypothetical protein
VSKLIQSSVPLPIQHFLELEENNGTMEQWNNGTMEQWNNGTMENLGSPSDTYIPANTPMRNKFSLARASGGKELYI